MMHGKIKTEIAVFSISYLDRKIMELEFEEKYKARMHNMAVLWVMRAIEELIDLDERNRTAELDSWFKYAITETIQEIWKSK